jgi:hypothetical protein
MADSKTYSIYNMQRKKVAWQNVEKQNILQDLRCQHVTYNSTMVKDNKIGKRELTNFNELQFIIFYMRGINYSETLCWKP